MIALMFGLAPIMAGLIGRFAFGQHLFKLQWLGMAVAVCGLAIICLNGSNQHVHPFGIVLMLVSVLFIHFLYLGKESDCQNSANGSSDRFDLGFFNFSKLPYSIYLAICTDSFTTS